MGRGFRTLAAGVCISGMLAGNITVGNGGPGVAMAATSTYVEWLRVAPSQPRTIWVGGELQCRSSASDGSGSCPGWAMRSLDGGTTWMDTSAGLARADAAYGGQGCSYTRAPAVLDPTGQQIAIGEDGGCASASSTYTIVLYSRDAGSRWSAITTNSQDGGYGAGAGAPAFSSFPPYTLWVVDTSADSDTVEAAWLRNGSLNDGANPAVAIAGSSGDDPILSLVPDPRTTTGVLANTESYVAFSPRNGSRWRLVTAPPKVKVFSVARDSAIPGGLIATSQDKRFPADRRWYSTNDGASWTAGVCAGDYKGICPLATVASAGVSAPAWAFNHAGVWTYLGHAGASGKAPVKLPVPPALVLDAGGNLGAATPLYILSNGTMGAVHGSLYRSFDGGSTWARITLLAPVLK